MASVPAMGLLSSAAPHYLLPPAETSLKQTSFLCDSLHTHSLVLPLLHTRAPSILQPSCSFASQDDGRFKLDKIFRRESVDPPYLRARSLPVKVARDIAGGRSSQAVTGRGGGTWEKVGRIVDLPVLGSPWALLPGSQDTLHVFQPHLVHMFETLLACPRPWRYGHLFVPEEPSASRPALGVVAEIQEVERFPDGRMLLLSKAVGRMRVLKTLAQLPFQQAMVEWAQDEEDSLVLALDPTAPWGEASDPLAPSQPASAFVHKAGVRSSGPDWDPEVAAAAVMVYELRRRERLLWDCYDQVRLLAGRMRMDGKVPPPPPGLMQLLPPERTGSGSGRSRETVWEEPAVVVDRVQRLSYEAAAALPDLSRGEGRQQLLAANSIRERMDLVAELMSERRNELAARVAVRDALEGAPPSQGSTSSQ